MVKESRKSFIVDPWSVSGDVDYEKIIKKFGVTPLRINDLPSVFQEEILFRRGTVFAHRDFSRIVSAIKNKKSFVMMTGLMPSGKFHLGHMLVARQMIFYQNLGAKIYIAVADLEAYNVRKGGKSLEELREVAIEEYLKNYIALGLKPKNVDFYFQSARSSEGKKSNAYYRLASQFSNYASFNEFKALYGDVDPGKISSSLLQAADMFHAQLPDFEGKPLPVVVPVGIDQDPHLRIARDMKKRYKDYPFVQLSSTYHMFLPGLKSGKMSSSDPNSYIALTDTPEDVERKIKKYAFSGGQKTVEEHRKKGGSPEKDVSFQYLKMFFEPNDEKLEKIYKDYKSGNLLTSELKELAIISINEFLREHQKRLKKADKLVKDFLK